MPKKRPGDASLRSMMARCPNCERRVEMRVIGDYLECPECYWHVERPAQTSPAWSD